MNHELYISMNNLAISEKSELEKIVDWVSNERRW